MQNGGYISGRGDDRLTVRIYTEEEEEEGIRKGASSFQTSHSSSSGKEGREDYGCQFKHAMTPHRTAPQRRRAGK